VPIGYLSATWKALAKVVTEKLFSSPITTCIKRLKVNCGSRIKEQTGYACAPAPKVALLESAGTTPALSALIDTNDAATSTDLANNVFLIINS
jgi:hypothetical protein